MIKKRLIITGWFIIIFLFNLTSVQGEKVTSTDFHSSFSPSVVDDTLKNYITEANNLWNKKESNLNLAFNLLSRTAKNNAAPYYDLATKFYFWSINNADFQQEKNAIEDEVNRLLPLVPDATQKKWQEYLKEEDPQLLREIIGFWQKKDPFSSTELNERLIEHWKRIQFAKANFDKASNSPYSTDDRGTFYIRLGAPDKRKTVTIDFSYITDPLTGEKLNFELGNIVNSEVEIWEYSTEYEDLFYLFGKKGGWGEYGLRTNAMELVDNSIRIAFNNSSWMSNHKIKTISENALQYGIYYELAPYHPFFQDMLSRVEERISGSSLVEPLYQRYSQNVGDVASASQHQMYRQQEMAPSNKTSLKRDDENLDVLTKTHRFLDQNNQNEYLFAIQPISNDLKDSFESMFLSNKLYVFDNQWTTLSTVDDLKKVNEDAFNNSYTYQISKSAVNNNVFFSSEIIDTTRSDIFIPGRLNPKTSVIIKSTGKEKISFSDSLTVDKTLLVSDILVGREQKTDQDSRVPISPSLDMSFDKNEEIMIYFEAYNIPEEGYSFTYYFEKERWLLGPKKVEDKSEVTILADDAKDRDDQFFSINLDNLDSGSYHLVFEFSPIDQNTNLGKRQKTVNFDIVE